MSALVFPAVPGWITESREIVYPSTVTEAVSGREDRVLWASAPRYRWSVNITFLRSTVNCTSAGWTTYSELAAVQFMVNAHYAAYDSFHITDPWDGTTDRVVRFVEGSVRFSRVVDGVWSCEFELISVI